MRFLKLLSLLSILVLGFLELMPTMANAGTSSSGEPVQVFGVTQQDLNGDGTPDVTVIECAFATVHDRVLVYDQNGDMPAGSQWDLVTDFRDDLWIFDVGADGSAQLIVNFDVDVVNDWRVAKIYDDMDGDGKVDYHIEANQVIIEESTFWHVKILSDQPWDNPVDWGQSSGQITFLVDGYDGLVLYMDKKAGNYGNGTDGMTDWELNIGDSNGDGINDYQMERAVNPVLIENYISQFPTAIYSQVSAQLPTPYENFSFWPLLIRAHRIGAYRYFDHPPAIAVDWNVGTVVGIGIMGFPIERGYHIYSRLPLEKHAINTADFENPMAYFDLAGDQDGWPELNVRFDVTAASPPSVSHFFERLSKKQPRVEINYSWDQDNDNRWDYKINLIANYPIDEVITFPDFAVKTVPYNEVIPWVRGHTWDIAMMVFDGKPTMDSEGMFARGWHIVRGYADGKRVQPSGVGVYLNGDRDYPPVENFQDIEEGMRGEYNFHYFDAPQIYLDALDRQLHLLGAQSGVWHLAGDHYIRYANLDHDDYLDQWIDERNDMRMQQINYSNGFYVYSNNELIRLKMSELSNPSLFVTQPPASNEEWKQLNHILLANKMDLLPYDFSGMVDLLPGPDMTIHNASMDSFRIVDGGFRFELMLNPDYYVNGEDILNLDDISPGRYVVTFQNNLVDLKVLTEPSLAVSVMSTAFASQQYVPDEIIVLVKNNGLQDVKSMRISVQTVSPRGKIQTLEPIIISAPSGVLQKIKFPWTPHEPGMWTLHPLIEEIVPTDANIDVYDLQIVVSPAEQVTLKESAGLLQNNSATLSLLGLVWGGLIGTVLFFVLIVAIRS